jgi:hypothetical protein
MCRGKQGILQLAAAIWWCPTEQLPRSQRLTQQNESKARHTLIKQLSFLRHRQHPNQHRMMRAAFFVFAAAGRSGGRAAGWQRDRPAAPRSHLHRNLHSSPRCWHADGRRDAGGGGRGGAGGGTRMRLHARASLR